MTGAYEGEGVLKSQDKFLDSLMLRGRINVRFHINSIFTVVRENVSEVSNCCVLVFESCYLCVEIY